MLRTMIQTILVLIFNLMILSNRAMAFTVRFGPVSVAEDAAAIHVTAGADIPTPRLFNVALGPDGLTFGPIATPPEETVTVPTVTVHNSAPSSVAAEQPTPRDRGLTSPRQLSGVEIMLLQRAKQVAAR
jgi:hypothetical protein